MQLTHCPLTNPKLSCIIQKETFVCFHHDMVIMSLTILMHAQWQNIPADIGEISNEPSFVVTCDHVIWSIYAHDEKSQ